MKIIIGFLILFFLSVSTVYAAIGVGIFNAGTRNLGNVNIKTLYEIGNLEVFNSGDEYGCYKMDVSYFQNQPEKRISSQWIIYNPEEFCLTPFYQTGEFQLVNVKLYINPKYKIDKGLKGDYFSFLEACTFEGSIGACAAAKLYLTI